MSMIWCWWCCHPFDGCPVHLPYKYDDRRNHFHTTGHFCSWNCAKAYALDNHKVKGGIICEIITLMKKRSHPENKTTLTSIAPSRLALKVFGGTLTIEEFRHNHDTIKVRLPNESHILQEVKQQQPTIIEHSHSETGDLNNNKLKQISNSQGTNNEPLKLKRSKPTKKSSQLENSLNMFLKKK
jgi:hypothetical protein